MVSLLGIFRSVCCSQIRELVLIEFDRAVWRKRTGRKTAVERVALLTPDSASAIPASSQLSCSLLPEGECWASCLKSWHDNFTRHGVGEVLFKHLLRHDVLRLQDIHYMIGEQHQRSQIVD